MQARFLPIVLIAALAHAAAPRSEADIDALVAQMSVREKVGQLHHVRITTPDIENLVRRGEVGGLCNVRDHTLRLKLERIALKESPHGIPLLHGADVIHGYRTQFPIPLGQAAAWDARLVEQSSRAAAVEATPFGIRWIFAPMVDVCRDPRWGRVSEGYGEDAYLTGVMGAAVVRGFQGGGLSRPDSAAACPKHYAGYGAAEGGRDYNTAELSQRTLREVYLPPFKACIDAGAPSVMAAFALVNGLPASANPLLLNDILRKEWGFAGFVVSDAKAVNQLVPHGLCADEKDAARQALLAGLDVSIIDNCYHDHLETLVKEGAVPSAALDESVRRLLRVKWKLGLFEASVPDGVPADAPPAADHVGLARELAARSLVLLHNPQNALPLSADLPRLAVIGPLADAPKDQMGTWAVYGKAPDTRTPRAAFAELFGPRLRYAAGLATPLANETDGFEAAVAAAREANATLLFLGEPASYSGEAHSRAFLTIPGRQMELYRAVRAATRKPLIVVLMAGRPLEVGELLQSADALVMAWHPGTAGGDALADVLLGRRDFVGRLPLSWPRSVGQIPVHYDYFNTGRPAPNRTVAAANDPRRPDTSHVTGYVDSPTAPQFTFGFGLSYTSFEFGELRIEGSPMSLNTPLRVSVRVSNTGQRAGETVAQLYVRDLAGSVPRPVRQLKGFTRVSLQPGESKTLHFTLTAADLAFYGRDMRFAAEPGRFHLFVGGDSEATLTGEFELR